MIPPEADHDPRQPPAAGSELDPDRTWPAGLDTLPAPPPARDSDEPTDPGTPTAVRRQSEQSMRALDATRLAELQALADAEKEAAERG